MLDAKKEEKKFHRVAQYKWMSETSLNRRVIFKANEPWVMMRKKKKGIFQRIVEAVCKFCVHFF